MNTDAMRELAHSTVVDHPQTLKDHLYRLSNALDAAATHIDQQQEGLVAQATHERALVRAILRVDPTFDFTTNTWTSERTP